MKSILVLSIILFFLVAPAYAQLPLSDATGFINRLNVETSGHIFEIKLVSNFDLIDYTFEKDTKELILYLESGLENNLAEIMIPTNLLNGTFTFILNDQEFFPKIQSNEKIHFITMNFTGSGSNVISIISSEYLIGLSEITLDENQIPQTLDADFLPPDGELGGNSSNFYLLWLAVGGIVITIVVFAVTKFLKNKN
ncbi:hypothetical protein OAI97_01790 [Nitrosopumilus sp.]|nr:hypothetical protein [Nitrosopumilus sp.]